MNEDRLNQLEKRLAKLDAQRPRDLKWALQCVDDDCLCDDDADEQTKLATAKELLTTLVERHNAVGEGYRTNTEGIRQWVGEFEKELLKEIGIDINALTDEQLETILIPVHAPENYYQDGEISPKRADYLHSQRLIQCGIVGDLYKKAWKLAE